MAENSQHEMNGKYTHCAHCRLDQLYSSSPIPLPRREHDKSQIRSVQGYVFGRERTYWKALVRRLI